MNKFGISSHSCGKCPRGLSQFLGKETGMGLVGSPTRNDGTRLESHQLGFWEWISKEVSKARSVPIGISQFQLGSINSYWYHSLPTGINQLPLGSVGSCWDQSIFTGIDQFPLGSISSHWDQSVPTGISRFLLGLVDSYWDKPVHIGISQLPLG